ISVLLASYDQAQDEQDHRADCDVDDRVVIRGRFLRPLECAYEAACALGDAVQASEQSASPDRGGIVFAGASRHGPVEIDRVVCLTAVISVCHNLCLSS